jgi:predicted transposase/invertase (TIGR01784 family)
MKKILREKANFDILEGFLSELLCFDITIQEILESESNQDSEKNKFNRVDLLAKDDKDRFILIELQHDSENDYFHRMVYGASKLISDYFDIGEPYSKIKKVYSVNIVYFGLGQGRDYLYHGTLNFIGMNQNDTLELNKKQKELFGEMAVKDIFPEFYIIKVNNFDKLSKKSTIDEWIYFLKTEEIKEDFRAKGLEKAKEKLDILKLPNKEKIAYKRTLENKSLEKSVMETARFEGKLEGEKQAKMEIAKMLLSIGDDMTKISKVTGLTIEDIRKL